MAGITCRKTGKRAQCPRWYELRCRRHVWRNRWGYGGGEDGVVVFPAFGFLVEGTWRAERAQRVAASRARVSNVCRPEINREA
jgi:metallophosphoesterase superfamily enzyme